MEGAEPKTKTKRIRHCYPRQEVYHRFIHDNEYYYSNKAHAISSKGNYLAIGDIGRYKSVEDIEKYWYPYNRVFAVIDRENKKILVSHKYRDLTYELIRAIPDDYTVFHCNDDIPVYNILHDENIDALAKLHLQHCIESYVKGYLLLFYACLKGKKVLHVNIDSIIKEDNCKRFCYYEYGAIKQFVRKYKVKSRTWYNKSLNTKFKLNIYYPNYWNSITIELPTVKQVITNTVFSKSQIDLFRKRYFYTKHCFGRGIPFSDVDKYFGTSITHDEAVRYCNKRNIYLNTDWLVDVHTWNELISKTLEIERKIHKNYVAEQLAKSEANYNAALEELRKIESDYTVNSWREGKINIGYNSVSYRKYIAPSSYKNSGTWMTATIHSSCKTFTNTQLKLEGNIIRTSRNATVTLEEGIKMYKMFMIYRNNNPDRTTWTTSYFGRVNVGVYNLRFITYKDKVSDTGRPLGYKEWCIQIGCHSLWLDDIEDFIKYYHLEDKFHYNTTTKNN